MTTEKSDWLPRTRAAILIAATAMIALFFTGIVGAGLFVIALFLLTATWLVNWLHDVYLADLAERAELRRYAEARRTSAAR